jgi:hypothetical protein
MFKFEKERLAQNLVLFLSQSGREFCPPPTLDSSKSEKFRFFKLFLSGLNYRIRLYTATICVFLTLVANVCFINLANAFHRKSLYKNITIILLLIAILDIAWAMLAAVEIVLGRMRENIIFFEYRSFPTKTRKFVKMTIFTFPIPSPPCSRFGLFCMRTFYDRMEQCSIS